MVPSCWSMTAAPPSRPGPLQGGPQQFAGPLMRDVGREPISRSKLWGCEMQVPLGNVAELTTKGNHRRRARRFEVANPLRVSLVACEQLLAGEAKVLLSPTKNFFDSLLDISRGLRTIRLVHSGFGRWPRER